MKLNEVNIVNRRARFDYEISETFTAGIVLTGTEIKSIRLGKAGLTDTFCLVSDGEVWVKNMYVAEYFYGSYNNHSARRDGKLLRKAGKDAGFTVVPLKVFINAKGLAKMVVGIGRGKKEYDKRQAIKERDDKRQIARMFQKK